MNLQKKQKLDGIIYVHTSPDVCYNSIKKGQEQEKKVFHLST